MDVGVLLVDIEPVDPGAHEDVAGTLPRERVLVVECDVRRVPDDDSQLVALRLPGRDVRRRGGHSELLRDDIDNHFQSALLDTGALIVEERAGLDVLRHELDI